MADLDRFPRPSVAVDVAVLTVIPAEHGPGTLAVLLHRRKGDQAGQWALPGRFVRERQRLADAVADALEEKCGLPATSLSGARPRQLHVFDDPARDDRGWVMSVAHVLPLPYDELREAVTGEHLTLAPVRGHRAKAPGQQRLPYAQDDIVAFAVEDLRQRYRERPDPDHLLGIDEFTLSQLRDLHMAVIGDYWQVDTFRRHMGPHLKDTGRILKGTVGRPAALFSRT